MFGFEWPPAPLARAPDNPDARYSSCHDPQEPPPEHMKHLLGLRYVAAPHQEKIAAEKQPAGPTADAAGHVDDGLIKSEGVIPVEVASAREGVRAERARRDAYSTAASDRRLAILLRPLPTGSRLTAAKAVPHVAPHLLDARISLV